MTCRELTRRLNPIDGANGEGRTAAAGHEGVGGYGSRGGGGALSSTGTGVRNGPSPQGHGHGRSSSRVRRCHLIGLHDDILCQLVEFFGAPALVSRHDSNKKQTDSQTDKLTN